MFNRCYFCLSSKSILKNILCQKCVHQFENNKFYSCPRCSKFDCSGCERLTEFRSIFCLYTYNNLFSKILVGAKDKFNILLQKAFEEIFYDIVREEIRQICHNKQYTHIILSPYHKKRMFHGHWHPNLFFQRLFLNLKKSDDFHFEILNPHFDKKMLLVFDQKTQQSLMQIDQKEKAILICDDVLTTGLSALKAHKALEDYFGRDICHIDLFTIFRSPQAS